MYPVILELGPLKLHSYGLMIALGFLAVLYLIQRAAEKEGIPAKTVHEMCFWGLFWGIAGTRVLHIIMYPENYSWSDPIGWIALWQGGLVFQGALPAVFLYVYLGLKKRGIPFMKAPDLVFPYFPLGHAFGRVGCFLNGCCHGVRADGLPWAVSFPRWPRDLADPQVVGSPPYLAHARTYPDFSMSQELWSHPVHPAQLYSVAGLALISLTLIALKKKWNPFEGFTLPLYMMMYGAGRTGIEFVRGDGNPMNLGLGILTNQQVFSLLMAFAGLGLFLWLRQRAERTPGQRAV